MADKAVKVNVRTRKRRGRVKGKPAADWVAIRTAYVTGGMGLRALAATFNVPSRTVAWHSTKEDWPRLRHQHQMSIAAELQQEAAEDTLTYKLVAAKNIRAIKTQALENLQGIVDAGGVLKAADIALLQRLEMDLLDPGWAKSEAEKKGTGTNVNVLVGLETTVLDTLRERGLLESQPRDVTADTVVTDAGGKDADLSDTKPDTQVTGYLYGDDGEDSAD